MVVILGTATVGEAVTSFEIARMPLWIGGAVAAVGTLQLVFDFGGSARTHQSLQRDYFNLLADIEEKTDPTEEDCRRWEAKMSRIAGDEPPVFRALDAKAYNDAIGAMEWDENERLVVPLIHRLLGSVISFDGHHYRKVVSGKLPALPAE
ncbi:hypothetical protein [Mesorhizobium sp. J428]|uniref:hypothetical protein n=1 Tax=Mesorhizobium sp. J428 TaxID=2898440 RepID=UPI0021512C51|nr:hypothetical protein [Mesorhizobium sp. J428]MCR5855292.1 hypothetical protein [Mesorhizobium sp. J428]